MREPLAHSPSAPIRSHITGRVRGNFFLARVSFKEPRKQKVSLYYNAASPILQHVCDSV